jgi:hypothetical protein
VHVRVRARGVAKMYDAVGWSPGADVARRIRRSRTAQRRSPGRTWRAFTASGRYAIAFFGFRAIDFWYLIAGSAAAIRERGGYFGNAGPKVYSGSPAPKVQRGRDCADSADGVARSLAFYGHSTGHSAGYSVGTRGYSVGARGYSVGTLWVLCGYSVGTLWVLCGYSVGARGRDCSMAPTVLPADW